MATDRERTGGLLRDACAERGIVVQVKSVQVGLFSNFSVISARNHDDSGNGKRIVNSSSCVE
jgi:hypothetical protein